MPQLQFTIPDFNQRSAWNYTLIVPEPPSTSTVTKTVDISTIPQNAILEYVYLSQSRNEPFTGISLRRLDDVDWAGTKDVTSKIAALSRPFTTVDFEFKFKANGNAGAASSWLNLSNTVLTVTYHMPTSTGALDKSAVNAGDDIKVTITPAESGRTHRALWTFGSYSSDSGILSAATLTHTLSVPMSWLNNIPNATSGVANCRLETYDSGSLLGYNDYPFTIACPGSIIPALTLPAPTHIPYSEGVSTWGYIQGKSKASMSITEATGAYGSTIVSYNIIGGGYDSGASASLETGFINAVGTVTFTARVTDSRGRTNTATQSVNFQAYVKPWFVSTLAQRCTAAGVIDIAGTYALVYTVFDKTAVGTNSVSGTVSYMENPSGGWSTPVSIASGVALTLGSGDFNVGKTYSIKLTISDALSSTEYYEYISVSAFLAEFAANGKRAGLLTAYGDEDETIKLGGWLIAPTGEKIAVPVGDNLLINANFVTPVNQRGNPNYTPGDYGYDRWRLDGAGGTFRDGDTLHIVATADNHAFFSQPIEHPELLSGTHIIAIYANGEGSLHLGCTVNGTLQRTPYDMTGQGWRWYTHIVDLPDSMTSFTVSAVAIAGGHYWIKHAKLEKGSILTPFVPKLYGEELAACKRCYLPKHTAPLIYQSGSYFWACPGNFPVEMRTVPTVTSAKYGLIGSYEYPLVGTFSLDETGSLYVLTGTNLASGTTQDYYVVFEGLDAEIR